MTEPKDSAKPKTLKATHRGEVRISEEIVLSCAVLEDRSRVLSQKQFVKAMGRTGNVTRSTVFSKERNAYVPVFLSAKNLQPYITPKLLESAVPVRFRESEGGGGERLGYRADFLPEVCNVFLDAKEAGILEKQQEHIAERCKLLLRAYATIGIVALIDEATGYQEVRSRDALEQILAKYLKDHKLKWAKTFPDDFYQQIFRLQGWNLSGTNARPGVVGHFTNDIVYARLAPGVLNKLKELNPITDKGRRSSMHHQWLTEDHGVPELKTHLSGVTALMRASASWRGFISLLNRAYPKPDTQFTLEGLDEDELQEI